jgi:FtsP/CotA-like multicopper oxidase with cupredoxin domain
MVSHPIHLHGFELILIDMGQFNDTSYTLAEKLKILSKKSNTKFFERNVIKDTLPVPSNGYVIFRFKADNPGWWLLHCHFGK